MITFVGWGNFGPQKPEASAKRCYIKISEDNLNEKIVTVKKK
jgi:hypothetical protein